MLLYSLLLTDTLTSLSVQDNKKIKSTGFKYIAVFVKKVCLLLRFIAWDVVETLPQD